MGGWWVIVSGLLMLSLTIGSSFSLSLAERFDREGKLAEALVTTKFTTESRDSDGDVSTTYWLTLEYLTHQGKEIAKDATVSGNKYRSTQEGDLIELKYLQTEPERIEIDLGSNRRVSQWTQRFSLAVGLAWLLSLWIIGGWAVAAVRARRFGTRTTAMVEEVAKTAIRINGRTRYRLVWKDASGRSGRSLLQKHAVVAAFNKGDQIEIYQGIKFSWWVGDVGERDEYSR